MIIIFYFVINKLNIFYCYFSNKNFDVLKKLSNISHNKNYKIKKIELLFNNSINYNLNLLTNIIIFIYIKIILFLFIIIIIK